MRLVKPDNEKPRKILLSAFIGSDNTGDNAISMSMVRRIREQITDADVTALSINPLKTERLLGIRAISSKSFWKILSAVAHTDVFICGGGGILQDQTSVFNIPARLAVTFLAALFRKTTMFYGVGAGPITTASGKFLVRMIANKAHTVTVRDQESRNTLLALGINPLRITVTGDPAINLPLCSEGRINQILIAEGIPAEKPLVGVCLRHWFDTHYWIPANIAQKFNLRPKGGKDKYNRFIENISYCLNAILDREDVNVVFIPFWRGRDDKVHQDVYKNLKNKEAVYHIKGVYRPDEILGIISKTHVLLGMRLHSLIFAAVCGIPMIALNYTMKVNNFMNAIGESHAQTGVEETDTEKLVDMINKALDNKSNARNKIARRVRIVKRRELENIKRLKKLLNSP
jgi:polysaccharide pyruvyl transferase WcaK-like protein